MVREEQQGECSTLRAAVLQREAAIVEVREGTLAHVTKMRSEGDSGAACLHDLLVSIRRILESLEKSKVKAVDNLAKDCKVYEEW